MNASSRKGDSGSNTCPSFHNAFQPHHTCEMAQNARIETALRGGGSCHSQIESDAIPPPPAPVRVANLVEKSPMSDDEMQRGLDIIASALVSANESSQYRIIGAGALWAMGLVFIQTADFDILVADGAAAATKRKLLQDKKFVKTSLKSIFLKVGAKNFNVDIIETHRAGLDVFPHREVYPQYTTSH